VSALVLSFDSAPPDMLLTPSPALMAQAAQCGLQASRAAQLKCKQQLIAAWRAPEKQGLQMARS